jgi:hypothetical protein
MNVIATWGRENADPGCNGVDDVWPVAFFAAEHDGATHNYKVVHENNQFLMLMGSQVLRSPIPESYICWTTQEATWFFESHDFGDAIGGTPNLHSFIRDANYSNAENGGFFLTSWNPANACNIGPPGGGIFFCDIVSSIKITAWTQRIP